MSTANRLAAGSAANTKDKVTDEDKGEASLKPTQRAEMVRSDCSGGRAQADGFDSTVTSLPRAPSWMSRSRQRCVVSV